LFDEWHQMYLPGRKAGWADFSADAAGSLIGIALLEVGWWRRNQHGPPNCTNNPLSVLESESRKWRKYKDI